jgi:hypothetical protein
MIFLPFSTSYETKLFHPLGIVSVSGPAILHFAQMEHIFPNFWVIPFLATGTASHFYLFYIDHDI